MRNLKGPRHGGANLKVQKKKAFDGSGLIYGMGHAVYTLSDLREVVLKSFTQKLANEKGLTKEFEFNIKR